jgi:tetratricopeptide (TPR) repeat protein
MKLFSKFLLFAAMAMLVGALALAQGTGAISGKVIDRDGKTPVVGATVRIQSLTTDRGQQVVRETLETKTGRDGGYSMSGVYQGRVRLILIMNGQQVMVMGEKIGDELVVANGLDLRANFDLTKAPALPPAGAAAATPTPANEADRQKLREQLEKEAANEAAMTTAFEAGKKAFGEKNFAEAVTQFKIAAEKGAKVDIVWANLARSQDMAKQYDDAIVSYQRAIELKPTESNYFLNLGVVQFSAGKVDEGTVSLKKAVELNPSNGGLAYYNLGATMVNRGKTKEASDAFKEAIKLDPNYANAYYELAIVYFGSQETIPQAVPLLEQYLKLAPTGPNATGAKALIDAAKATAPTTYQSPEAAAKAKADADKAAAQPKGGKGGKQ